jgi:hypothetical protein
MMKYGADPQEHRFHLYVTEIERRGQWVDVYVSIHLEAGEHLPDGLAAPSVLVICNLQGEIVQVVLHDEGCDSEFQFTLSEKAHIEAFVHAYWQKEGRNI